MSEAAPVAELSRIKSLDVMRAFAVLGILIVNAQFFAAPWQTSQNPLLEPLAVDESSLWSWTLMHVFFEFKCITLFSLLFGASLYLVGGERSDLQRGAILHRRLVWLLIFGLIHGIFIWYGDILVTYALTGFLVLFARSWSARTLFCVGVAILLFATATHAFTGFAYEQAPADWLAEIRSILWEPSDAAETIADYRGSLFDGTLENAITWSQIMTSSLPALILRSAGVMMIGMALFKWGFLSGNAPNGLYWITLAVGAIALAIIAYQAWLNWQLRFDFMHMITRGGLANTALAIFVSIAYASLFVLLVKAGARFITEPLAAVGRMAFTNYIAQSVIMTTVFWGGRGFGLFGEIDRPTLTAIVFAVWALQLIWSPLWLSRFSMGPLEWLWRRLSYARPVEINRTAKA